LEQYTQAAPGRAGQPGASRGEMMGRRLRLPDWRGYQTNQPTERSRQKHRCTPRPNRAHKSEGRGMLLARGLPRQLGPQDLHFLGSQKRDQATYLLQGGGGVRTARGAAPASSRLDLLPIPLVCIVCVLPPRVNVRLVDVPGDSAAVVRVGSTSVPDRDAPAVAARSSRRMLPTKRLPTAHFLAISRSDHCDHSGSASGVSTARRLSALLRGSPCWSLATTA
jgi:hypothetical protein